MMQFISVGLLLEIGKQQTDRPLFPVLLPLPVKHYMLGGGGHPRLCVHSGFG